MNLSGQAAGLIAIGLLFAFMLASIPVFVAMGLAAFIGFVMGDGFGQALSSFAQIVWQSSSIFELVAIPLFIFAGLLSEQISAGRDLFDVAKAWVGRAPAVGVTTTPLWPYTMAQDKAELEPDKPLFRYFDSLLEKSNTRILALFDIGPAVVSTGFPLRTPAEIKGRVIRAVSKGSAEVLRALGASPVVLSVGDVYSALQRHTIDGAFSGLGAAAGLKYYEVSKYLMGTNGLTGAFINGYVMNLAKFNSLPQDLQKVLLDAAAKARDETQDALIKAYGEDLKKIAGHGVEVYVPQPGSKEWSAWQSALADFKAQSGKSYPPELVKLLAH